MFSDLSKITHSTFHVVLMLFIITGLTACNSEQPELMKAVKQFKTDEIRDNHVAHMRKNHMDELLHKRDETMKKGIRTEDNSLKACINCHVPKEYKGKILRHTDPEHFCATCHIYVAAKPDCFQCHVDHPVSDAGNTAEVPNDVLHNGISSVPTIQLDNTLAINTKSEPSQDNLDTKVLTGESTSE